jgi:hypothetical protein
MRKLIIPIILATLAIGVVGATVASPVASAATTCGDDTKTKQPK